MMISLQQLLKWMKSFKRNYKYYNNTHRAMEEHQWQSNQLQCMNS
jgi:hypothetical protein